MTTLRIRHLLLLALPLLGREVLAEIPAAPAPEAPAAKHAKTPSTKYAKPGFVVFEDGGRLWVFKEDEKALKEFLEHGELVKMVVRPGAGPDRMTVRASDAAVIEAYMAAQ